VRDRGRKRALSPPECRCSRRPPRGDGGRCYYQACRDDVKAVQATADTAAAVSVAVAAQGRRHGGFRSIRAAAAATAFAADRHGTRAAVAASGAARATA